MTTALVERLKNQLEAKLPPVTPETIPASPAEKSTPHPVGKTCCLGSLSGLLGGKLHTQAASSCCSLPKQSHT